MADPEVLPAEQDPRTNLVPQFIAVDVDSTDKETTIADLDHINVLLERCHYAAPYVKTLGGLAALSATVCKLIEVRRAVKKLPYGSPKNISPQGRSLQTLE